MVHPEVAAAGIHDQCHMCMTLLLEQVHSPAELEQLIETRLPAFLDRMPVGVIGSRIHPSMRAILPARSPTTLASCPTHAHMLASLARCLHQRGDHCCRPRGVHCFPPHASHDN